MSSLRNFIEVSSVKCGSDIFLRVRRYPEFLLSELSLLTHRNFFNHVENVNYLITGEWPR